MKQNRSEYQVEYRLPFSGQWFVFWGGDTKEQNHHRDIQAQRYGLDLVKVDNDGKSHSGSGGKNLDYYAFGEQIMAPANGKIIEAVEGVRDNVPGETNHYQLCGNYVLIKHNEREFSLLAHLQCGSVVVKNGESVTAGQKIGRCGNSGNSSEPHLHFHLQDSATFARFKNSKRLDVAKGIKCYFSNVVVYKNNEERKEAIHSPIKGEIISNP